MAKAYESEPDSRDVDYSEKDEDPSRPRTNGSSTVAEEDDLHLEALRTVPKRDKESFIAGTPDIDHEEIEAAVPGHELDVELGKVSHFLSLTPPSPRPQALGKGTWYGPPKTDSHPRLATGTSLKSSSPATASGAACPGPSAR